MGDTPVNKAEAREVLAGKLADLRRASYDELRPLLDAPQTEMATAPSGQEYQVEINAVWDDRKDGNLRVLGAIDEGGLPSFLPLTDDFIITPEGDFVGE